MIKNYLFFNCTVCFLEKKTTSKKRFNKKKCYGCRNISNGQVSIFGYLKFNEVGQRLKGNL